MSSRPTACLQRRVAGATGGALPDTLTAIEGFPAVAVNRTRSRKLCALLTSEVNAAGVGGRHLDSFQLRGFLMSMTCLVAHAVILRHVGGRLESSMNNRRSEKSQLSINGFEWDFPWLQKMRFPCSLVNRLRLRLASWLDALILIESQAKKTEA